MAEQNPPSPSSAPAKTGAVSARPIALRKRAEFLAVAASGKKWVAPGFIMQIGPPRPPGDSAVHFGLTASRKVGNAVTRNRCRRRLRALAMEILPHALPEHDYVLIARQTTAAHDFAAMRADMVKGLKRMKAWRG